ncbi:carboxylating nicotinate-nucleotide diphosphorylase [bacterium]|nr:carboxylating nicotinate-nucleotide diphosphorylase [bacterium]
MIKDIVKKALHEDLPTGVDVTTDPLLGEELVTTGIIQAKAEGILAGIKPAIEVFHTLDSGLQIEVLKNDGDALKPGDKIMRITGNLRAILRGERTALNFLCHLSGIATLTAEFVRATKGCSIEILGTRKTSPGLRALEVEAIRSGGGDCYRDNLQSAVLIKDNHLAALGGLSGLTARLSELAKEAPDTYKDIIERGKLEVTSIEELKEGIRLGFQSFLLDNFQVSQVEQAVKTAPKAIQLEVSGGVNLQNVQAYARTGAHAISIGALTHSAPSLDLSLEIDKRQS